MEYISAKEAANKWGITTRMVCYHCSGGSIEGAQMVCVALPQGRHSAGGQTKRQRTKTLCR